MAASAMRSTAGQWSRKSAAVGIFSIAASAASSRNAGGSSSLRRITRATATTIALSQNGIRQPQLSSWSSGTAPMVGGVLEAERVRARLLAGGGEALQQPQAYEQDRRPDPDGVVAGQAADEEGRGAHQRDGEDQDALAAVLVADVAHEERADRPRDVADAVGGERQQRARRGVGLGEEDLAEDQRGGSAVDEE